MNNDKLSQIKGINKVSFLQRLKSYKRKPGSFILLLLVGLAALATTLSQTLSAVLILIKLISSNEVYKLIMLRFYSLLYIN